MTAQSKTNSLVRKDIEMGCLVKNEDNPNRMSDRAFDLLVDNMNRTGITDPILVRPVGDGKYRIVGGHHRFDAAQYLGFKTVPCTIIEDDDFDDDAENFQLVRMNMISGKLDPTKFYNLYQKVADKYSDAILQEAFGFAEETEFKKLISKTAAQIEDPFLKDKFKEAAKEVKTVDGLAKLLNKLFTMYGDTLPYGFMHFDYGGQKNVWVQITKDTLKAFDIVGTLCIDKERTVDDIVGGVLQLIAKGDIPDVVDKLVSITPPVDIPKALQVMPTKENIKDVADL